MSQPLPIEVIFGRTGPGGIRTKGIIEKFNPARATIRTTEARGAHPPGIVWKVPYEMIQTLDGKSVGPEGVGKGTGPDYGIRQPMSFGKEMPNEFWIRENVAALEILSRIYSGLAPENLSCDGEASAAHIRKTRSKLDSQLRAVALLLGRPGCPIDEMMVYDIQSKYPDIFRQYHENMISMYKTRNQTPTPIVALR